jgi:hypothetical protein
MDFFCLTAAAETSFGWHCGRVGEGVAGAEDTLGIADERQAAARPPVAAGLAPLRPSRARASSEQVPDLARPA